MSETFRLAIDPVMQIVYQALALAVFALVIAALHKLTAWLGVSIDTKTQSLLETQLQAAIGVGKANAAATAIGLTAPVVASAVLNHATDYFMQRFPANSARIARAANGGSTAAAVAETLSGRLSNVNLTGTSIAGLGTVPDGVALVPAIGVAATHLDGA